MSSSQDHPNGNNGHGFDKKHLAIALGIGLSIVALITMCLLYLTLFSFFFFFFLRHIPPAVLTVHRLAIFLHNRNNERRRRPDRIKPKRSTSQKRLRKLDAELPSCTLEEWWSKTKVPPHPTEGTDGQFVWYASMTLSVFGRAKLS